MHKVSHAYGTNGIITEVTVPLTAAYDWVDVLVSFSDFAGAAQYADALANQDGILTKEIAPIGAPLPHDYFLRHRKFVRADQSVCAVMVAPFAMDAFAALHRPARRGPPSSTRSDTATAEESKGLPPVYELTWNHTTLRGLRVDSEHHLSPGPLSVPPTMSRRHPGWPNCSATRCRDIWNSCVSTARSPASACPSCATRARSG